jgi:hypothetical protein
LRSNIYKSLNYIFFERSVQMRHELDFAPIKVGDVSDWYAYDNEGNITSLDEYGNPAQDDAKWVEARKTANGLQLDCKEDGSIVGACIGGSSASIVAGIFEGHENGCRENTFNSKLSLYHELRGEKPLYENKDPLKKNLFYIGHTFEDAVGRSAIKRINETILKDDGLVGYLKNDTAMYRCGVKNEKGVLKYPHAIADLDRMIVVYPINTVVKLNDSEWVKNNPPLFTYGLEIKTTTQFLGGNPHWTIGGENYVGAPENYQVQTHHYMGVCNIDGFFIAVQNQDMSPYNLLIRFVERDIEIEKRILDNEETFIQNALKGIAPTEDEDVASKYQKTKAAFTPIFSNVSKAEDAFIMPEDLQDVVYEIVSVDDEISALKKQIKALEAKSTDLGTKLYSCFEAENKSLAIIPGDEGNLEISCNHKVGRSVTDIELLEKENPKLAALCVQKSVVVGELDLAQKEELSKYQSTPISPEMVVKVKFKKAKKEKKSTTKKAS